uniref:Uncharacterized protein n=1 Tax=Glossina austeni TaxID=7395 RepID=A0A1A9UHU3_GLOAU
MLKEIIKSIYRMGTNCFAFYQLIGNVGMFLEVLGLIYVYFWTICISMSVEKDLGRSMGKPNARSHIREENTPRARETPNNMKDIQ